MRSAFLQQRSEAVCSAALCWHPQLELLAALKPPPDVARVFKQRQSWRMLEQQRHRIRPG